MLLLFLADFFSFQNYHQLSIQPQKKSTFLYLFYLNPKYIFFEQFQTHILDFI